MLNLVGHLCEADCVSGCEGMAPRGRRPKHGHGQRGERGTQDLPPVVEPPVQDPAASGAFGNGVGRNQGATGDFSTLAAQIGEAVTSTVMGRISELVQIMD